jgi:hypothetical protein
MKQFFWFVAIALSLPTAVILPERAIAQPAGTIQCSGIRGDNAITRPIQAATLESVRDGYTLRFTELRQGQSIETVWQMDQTLIIESAKTGTAPEGRWNLRSYNRQPPVTIKPTGEFSINMMVSSRSACTFAGTLQFLGDTQSQLFPGAPTSDQKPPNPAAAPRRIAEGRYWVGATGMVIEVKGQRYQYRDEETATRWKPVSELTPTRDGVFKAGQTYWCLSSMPHSRLSVCTANGWRTSR